MNVKQFLYGLFGFALIVSLAYVGMNQLAQTSKLQQLETELENLKQSKPKLDTNTESALSQTSKSESEYTQSNKLATENPLDEKGLDSIKPVIQAPVSEGVEPINGMVQQSQGDAVLQSKESAAAEKSKQLDSIRNQLQAMITTDPKNIDFNKLDTLLVELQAMGDSKGVVGGVSIPQLRKILTQSNKILMTSEGRGLAPGEDKNAKLKQEVEMLQGLQHGIVVKDE